jgi:hypothetical protein
MSCLQTGEAWDGQRHAPRTVSPMMAAEISKEIPSFRPALP